MKEMQEEAQSKKEIFIIESKITVFSKRKVTYLCLQRAKNARRKHKSSFYHLYKKQFSII